METLQIQKSDALTAYNAGDEQTKKLLRNLFGENTFSQKITDRVKTFEDACKVLHVDPNDVLPPRVGKVMEPDLCSVAAYTKLILIARALNEGWKPDWTNGNEYKYYPYFDMSSGSALAYGGYVGWYSGSCVGSRLCYKTRELAEYAGKQFLSIYTDLFIIK